MTSELDSAFRISLRDAVCARLPGIETLSLPLAGASLELVAALPASYAARRTQQFPLLLALVDGDQVGSVVEMCRLMTGTKELAESIVVCVTPSAGLAPEALAQAVAGTVLAACAQQWRVDAGRLLAFSADESVAAALRRALPALRVLEVPAANAPDDALPALLRGLRATLATGAIYGDNVVALRKPWLAAALSALAPLMKRLTRKPPTLDPAAPYLLHSRCLDRHFEIFAALPASAATQPQRRYPLLLVLDANIEFSTVAETAARLAAAGRIEEMVVVGVGVPRALGETEFAFRRFEEFSAPADGYGFDDELGRIFRSLFAIRGQDAQRALGKAPGFYAFLVQELLPLLLAQLPVDARHCGLLGHSAGGAMLGYALLQADSPFSRYVSVSPGVGISGSWILRQLPGAVAAVRKDARLFLCVGSEELDNAFNRIAGIPQTGHYADQLRQLTGVDASYHCFEGTTHSSVFPAAVAMGLQRLYGIENRKAA
ncbi:MAG TPA: alpha/beta hydrolase-fold protein [Fontimonas sp.]